jgi:hypothetical protein
VNDAARNRNVRLALAALLAAMGGCAGAQRSQRPRQPAAHLEPVQVQLTVGLPFDSDGNGYPDTMQAIAYLFPDSRLSQLPVSDTGTFDFVMQDPSGVVAARWVFPPEIVAKAERNLPAGPGYSMYLRLSPGADERPPEAMDIRVQFVSESGTKVRSNGRTTVRLGG